jgi:hypothetical protein
MRKTRLFLAGALIAGSVTFVAATPEAQAGCCLPAIGDVSLTPVSPNANTHIVVSGQTVASDQPLTVAWSSQLVAPVSCTANPWNAWLGYTWNCTGDVTDFWVHLERSTVTNNVDTSRVWYADVHVYGGQGQDTINVHSGNGPDTVDCGANDGKRDYVYKDGNSKDASPTHCSNDTVKNTAPPA